MSLLLTPIALVAGDPPQRQQHLDRTGYVTESRNGEELPWTRFFGQNSKAGEHFRRSVVRRLPFVLVATIKTSCMSLYQRCQNKLNPRLNRGEGCYS